MEGAEQLGKLKDKLKAEAEEYNVGDLKKNQEIERQHETVVKAL